MKHVAFAATFALATAASAQSFEVIDAKITSSIADKEAADSKTTYTTGEKVWVWMKLKPNDDTAAVSLHYTVDGNDVWTMDPKKVLLGRTWYNKTVHYPGNWTVQIKDGDTVVKELTFTATGDPLFPMPGSGGGGGAAKGSSGGGTSTTDPSAVGESDHAGVVELKLAEEIKDRNPVAPGSSFSSGAKIYTWVKLNVKAPETTVKLRWLVGDKIVWTSDAIAVKQSPGWRTWYQKTVDVAGSWKVEVLDVDDKVLHVEPFTVN